VTERQRDVAEIVLGFARTLRHAGVPASPDRVQAMVAALGHLDVLDPSQVFWAGRLTLCADPADLERYDAAFAAYFGGQLPRTVRRTALQQVLIASLDPQSRDGVDGADDSEDGQPYAARASRQEVLRHRDVAELTPAEREEIARLFALLTPRVAPRMTRRYVAATRGLVDLERTVRRMLAQGGEPSQLARRTRRTKPRRLVLLIDVSGSMASYADPLLRFAHAAVRVAPFNTEVFTLGTRLTRVTRELRRRDPDRALAGVGRAIPDWSGGTRLGEGVQAFLDRWGQRGAARGAVVVVCSDGWERGDPSLLGEQLARLARLSHTVVWVNPYMGKEGFTPATGGMRAALPHISQLVAGHSYAALERLAYVIAHA
jgi:uncharacterized protein